MSRLERVFTSQAPPLKAAAVLRRGGIFNAGITGALRSVDGMVVTWSSSWNGADLMTEFYYAPDFMEPHRPAQKIYLLKVRTDDAGRTFATDPETGERVYFEVVRKAGCRPYLLLADEFERLAPVP